MDFNECLYNEAKKYLQIQLNDEQLFNFNKYSELLKEWNKVMNLTAIVNNEGIITKHFIDSLTVSKYINNQDKILDIGTGAGFPGLPIKILNNTIEVTLLDSLNKRINFLQEVIKSLQLENIFALHARAEEFARNSKYREKFDVVTARAVADLRVLSEYCIPYVKVGGLFIAMKSSDIENELNLAKPSINKLGGTILKVDKIKIFNDIERTLILIKKEKETPNIYPRISSKIEKSPL